MSELEELREKVTLLELQNAELKKRIEQAMELARTASELFLHGEDCPMRGYVEEEDDAGTPLPEPECDCSTGVAPKVLEILRGPVTGKPDGWHCPVCNLITDIAHQPCESCRERPKGVCPKCGWYVAAGKTLCNGCHDAEAKGIEKPNCRRCGMGWQDGECDTGGSIRPKSDGWHCPLCNLITDRAGLPCPDCAAKHDYHCDVNDAFGRGKPCNCPQGGGRVKAK